MFLVPNSYPDTRRDRDRWILTRRAERRALDPRRPVVSFVEEERSGSGEIVFVATVFLTNRECPWRCVMCDLWQNTLTESAPAGAIPEQIERALAGMATGGPAPRQIKLYNSGSFFDPRAIPPDDYPAIAQHVGHFERVIVEGHPSLVGPEILRFRDRLAGRLEVAMGLETAHPEVLERLNKGMTLDDFTRAAEFLLRHDVALRAFILVRPPFLPDEAEARLWVQRSIDFAFDCGASAASLIPTRGGNGAMETLASLGQFSPPRLANLEAAAEYGIGLRRGRVFADLWDLEKFSQCAACCDSRRQRLRRMNLGQQVEPPVQCEVCGTPARAPLSG
jgi:radical SAM enzyme (TIGR01210 family)